ncbi:helix-turn-helix domain-containing protein [Blastopirellula retiformator]|uniref:Helix-turn-helix domain protein n=1 Tax=Blastopirellula retiformator TaxID=2527970 RepID=A0A5C5VA22_9BACT|nr:helix-turn-helix domain-containing protein [Blastopirellula retiformator]TWT34803.1 Helix-turn-helix domain protein [Blastopirellula retiformator]
MLTVKEVASELRVCIGTVYKLIATGELPCYEFVSCKRVSEKDLRAYMELQRKEGVRIPRATKRHF